MSLTDSNMVLLKTIMGNNVTLVDDKIAPIKRINEKNCKIDNRTCSRRNAAEATESIKSLGKSYSAHIKERCRRNFKDSVHSYIVSKMEWFCF